MTVLEHVTPEALEAAVRTHPRLSAAVREIASRTGLPEEVVRGHLTELLRESLERLGESYVAHTTETITAIEGLRREVDAFYDRVLNGSDPDPDVAHLQDLFRQLHDRARELNDPQTWANEQPAPPVEPVTPPTEPAPHTGETGSGDTGRPRDDQPQRPPDEPPPGAAEALQRAEAIRSLREHARAQLERLEAEVKASREASARAEAEIVEHNRELRRAGVRLEWLSDPAYVERLPPEVRERVQQRQDLIDENIGRSLERAEAGRRTLAWRNAAGSDVVARRYAELRPRTPEGAARTASDAAQVDILGVPRSKANPIEPDHVVPVMEVVGMDNFVLLPDEIALKILNDPAYIEPLNRSANRSKGDWAWEDWPRWRENGVTPEARSARIARARELRKAIYDRIQAEAARLVGPGNLMPAVPR